LTAIGQLISGVAHELNNPLTAVLGYAQLAQSLSVEGELAEYLEQIAQQATRAGAIVGNLLTFARKKEPESEPLDLNAIVESCVELCGGDLSVSNIQVVRQLADDLPAVTGDFQQVQQVLLNLVNNADYAIRQHRGSGTITLRTSTLRKQDKPWVRLEVLDDGPGIPEPQLGRIFDPFFTTKPPGQGTGLGLSVSYGIILSHQGSISAENRPEGGARFVVELPAARTSRPGAVSPCPVAKVAPARVLVVEDEEAVARMLELLLRGDGHQVTVAGDGVCGLARLEEEQFDLVIIDLRMPRLSGRQFYGGLCAHFPELARRVVFVTGDVVSGDTSSFLQAARASVLAKPFTIDEARRVFYQKLHEVRG
jgi:two-component system NtrC family sensor kinase